MRYRILVIIFLFFYFTSCHNKNKQEAKQQSLTHDKMMATMFSPPKKNIKTVGILLYDGYSTLDAMGPYSVFSELMGTNVFFVGRQKGLVADSRGMKVETDTSIAEVKHLDVLVIPGGFKQTYEATKDEELLNWIKAIDSTSVYTTSVCTGAWILGATGLLKNKEATTHWWGKKILAEEYGAHVQNARYTHTGKYWTSAGITAGMDMSLALVNEIRGEKYTKAVMLDQEYDPQPPFKGGSESNTDKDLVNEMRAMYDAGMKAVLHPEEAYKNLHFDNPKDLTCGMPLSAGIGDTAHYKGKVYGFCSAECKNEFKRNPENYVSKK